MVTYLAAQPFDAQFFQHGFQLIEPFLCSGNPQNVLGASRVSFNYCEVVDFKGSLKRMPRSVSFLIGPSVKEKNLMCRFNSSLSLSIKWALVRSSRVFLSGGRLNGASMAITWGLLSLIFKRISMSE